VHLQARYGEGHFSIWPWRELSAAQLGAIYLAPLRDLLSTDPLTCPISRWFLAASCGAGRRRQRGEPVARVGNGNTEEGVRHRCPSLYAATIGAQHYDRHDHMDGWG
jgi:hypothetical protein